MAPNQNSSGNGIGNDQMLLPESFVPSDRDIIIRSRRGSLTAQADFHAGNYNFQEVVRQAIDSMKANRVTGSVEEIAGRIVLQLYSPRNEVHTYGVGFIKLDKSTGRWSRVSVDNAHRRVIHILKNAMNQSKPSISPTSSFSSLESSAKSTNATASKPQSTDSVGGASSPLKMNSNHPASVSILSTPGNGGLSLVATSGNNLSMGLQTTGNQLSSPQQKLIPSIPNITGNIVNQMSMNPLILQQQQLLLQQQRLLMELKGSNSASQSVANANTDASVSSNTSPGINPKMLMDMNAMVDRTKIGIGNLGNGNNFGNAQVAQRSMSMCSNTSSRQTQMNAPVIGNLGTRIESPQKRNSISTQSNNSNSQIPPGMPVAFAGLPPMEGANSAPPPPQQQLQQPQQMANQQSANIFQQPSPRLPMPINQQQQQQQLRLQNLNSNQQQMPQMPQLPASNSQFDATWVPNQKPAVVPLKQIPNKVQRIVFVRFSPENDSESQVSCADHDDDAKFFWPAMLFQSHEEFLALRGFEMTVKNTVALALRLTAVRKVAPSKEPIRIAELFGRTNDYVFALLDGAYRHSDRGLANAFAHASQDPPSDAESQIKFLEFCKGLDAAMVIICPDAKPQNWHLRALKKIEEMKRVKKESLSGTGLGFVSGKPKPQKRKNAGKSKGPRNKPSNMSDESDGIDDAEENPYVKPKVARKAKTRRKRRNVQDSSDSEGEDDQLSTIESEGEDSAKPLRVNTRAAKRSAAAARSRKRKAPSTANNPKAAALAPTRRSKRGVRVKRSLDDGDSNDGEESVSEIVKKISAAANNLDAEIGDANSGLSDEEKNDDDSSSSERPDPEQKESTTRSGRVRRNVPPSKTNNESLKPSRVSARVINRTSNMVKKEETSSDED